MLVFLDFVVAHEVIETLGITVIIVYGVEDRREMKCIVGRKSPPELVGFLFETIRIAVNFRGQVLDSGYYFLTVERGRP